MQNTNPVLWMVPREEKSEKKQSQTVDPELSGVLGEKITEVAASAFTGTVHF